MNIIVTEPQADNELAAAEIMGRQARCVGSVTVESGVNANDPSVDIVMRFPYDTREMAERVVRKMLLEESE